MMRMREQDTQESSYVSFFSKTFHARVAKNPQYSMGAFARDLGLSKASISEILNHKKGLSVLRARQIATKLGLSDHDRELFLAQVSARQHRSRAVRELAEKNLNVVESKSTFKEIDPRLKSIDFKWYHFALLTLLDVSGFSEAPDWIAAQLQITPAQAAEAWNILCEFGIVVPVPGGTGQWQRTNRSLINHSDKKSEAFMNLYRDTLGLAEKSISETPIDQRSLSTLFLSLTESDYAIVQKEIESFLMALTKSVAETGGAPDRVYCVALQSFPVTPPKKQEST